MKAYTLSGGGERQTQRSGSSKQNWQGTITCGHRHRAPKVFRQVRSQKTVGLTWWLHFCSTSKLQSMRQSLPHMSETVNFSTGCSAIISAFFLLANELFVRHAFFIAIRVIIFLWLVGIKVKGQVRGVHYDCRARWSKTNKKPWTKGIRNMNSKRLRNPWTADRIVFQKTFAGEVKTLRRR